MSIMNMKTYSTPKPDKEMKPVPAEQLRPEIKVEPKIEIINPAPDMAPIAEAIKQLMLPTPNVDVHVHESEKESKPKRVQIDVERDSRGFIKSLICTEIV